MTLYAKIIGTGSTLPQMRVDNADLVKYLAKREITTSDDWIIERTGIKSRYFADDKMVTSDLAASAGRKALMAANFDPEKLDLILVATATPDHLGGFPSTACITQAKLGIKNQCAAFDVQAVCSGFIYALTVAKQFISTGMYQNILVIGAEIFSRILNFDDRASCVLFGDGAGAILLSSSNTAGILASNIHSDGNYANILCMEGRLNKGALSEQAFLYMDGKAVFKLAVLALEQGAQKALRDSNLLSNQIDWLIPHQANIRIMQSFAKKINIPLEKLLITLDKHGNTSAASIPLALDCAIYDGKIKTGQAILLACVGGGLTWGASVVYL